MQTRPGLRVKIFNIIMTIQLSLIPGNETFSEVSTQDSDFQHPLLGLLLPTQGEQTYCRHSFYQLQGLRSIEIRSLDFNTRGIPV